MSTPSDDPRRALRRSVYLLLIFLGTGAMLGRILAVDMVSKAALQKYRVKKVEEKLNKLRDGLRGRGLDPEQVEAKVAETVQRERLWDWARLRRPFFSANDRSRWCTIRVLVEKDLRVEGHPYAIDNVQELGGWDTIDMVKHDGHLFSSKPPLLPTMMAGVYWVIYQVTGLSLETHTYAVVRSMLVIVNVVPLVIGLLLLARLVERLGTTDWGRLFVMGAAVFGTFLSTFAVTINNHLPAAVCAVAALYAAVRIWFDGQRRWRYFAVAGAFAGLAAANELPALAFLAALSAALLWKDPRRTVLAYVPGVSIVAAAFFVTNWLAHGSLRPPYMHRADIEQGPLNQQDQTSVRRAFRAALEQPKPGPFKETFGPAIEDVVTRRGGMEVKRFLAAELQKTAPKELIDAAREAIDEADLDADRADNWYHYAYRRGGRTLPSYWREPQGPDRGEDSPAVYALHVLVGHHGIFSLTPVWLLSAAGTVVWLCPGRDRRLRELAVLVGAVTLVCLAFYLSRGQYHRNYGGNTSGLRWMFWFAPMWLLVMLPAADAMARRWWTRGVALALLALSVLSASYPIWNPWTDPWIMDYLDYLDWIG